MFSGRVRSFSWQNGSPAVDPGALKLRTADTQTYSDAPIGTGTL